MNQLITRVYIYPNLFKHMNQLIFTEFVMDILLLMATLSSLLIIYSQYTTLQQMGAQTPEVGSCNNVQFFFLI
jgi:hypothetical protein